ncbi:MAG: hypothetical protein KDG51_12030, partial [Calditrichaeota bacterium]|nr:hypothetical protein [Calditrichota bacterium]
MRNFTVMLFLTLFVTATAFAKGPAQEASPNKIGHTYPTVTEAMWDLQFSYNLETVTGALGNAGSEFDGTY